MKKADLMVTKEKNIFPWTLVDIIIIEKKKK